MNEHKMDQISITDLKGKIEIFDFSLTLDGGSVSFYCRNHGHVFLIRLIQHVDLEKPFDESWLPGALYFNENIVAIDSPDEKKIISSLKNCTIKKELYEFDNSQNPLLSNSKTVVIGESLNKQFDAWRKSPGNAVEQFIDDSLAFLESKKYKEVAAIVGRL
ncbi:hypothetical protein [Dokdonia sp.]|uniref:hypothetical protein n=1 Tax=Dokdonia sp. TaxID=2024995 RepID=UPI0032678CC2